ncbi:uncharacterized protein LOC114518213 [Dendronephthya gigantea]|uniref:uncharacterized protein LOC114518213 n=1 Tax=Dendronephthya gigantea TaxID=151771 RepID=UPI00106A354B|nr:uncharacterized protein LOC114518213 [Dendronephthya gigantea]
MLRFRIMDKNGNESLGKQEELVSNRDILNKLQIFLDNNIRFIGNVSWIIGGIGLVVIIRRTYAFHHFTKTSSIPETYFKNNATLTGKVMKVCDNGHLGVLHLPLLWRARIKYITDPSLLDINISGIELQSGGLEFLNSELASNMIKFQLLGKDESDNIESIVYHNKGWLRRKSCLNEDIVSRGFATSKHVSCLSDVAAYNNLVERLVRVEVRAMKRKSGIWKEDSHGIFQRIWSWFRKKIFRN